MLEMETLYFEPTEDDNTSSQGGAVSISSIQSQKMVYGVSSGFVGFGDEIVPFANITGEHEPMKLVLTSYLHIFYSFLMYMHVFYVLFL